jgi:hypothetical protein
MKSYNLNALDELCKSYVEYGKDMSEVRQTIYCLYNELMPETALFLNQSYCREQEAQCWIAKVKIEIEHLIKELQEQYLRVVK